MNTKVTDALARVTAALPAAEERPGQQQMAAAVGRAIETGHVGFSQPIRASPGRDSWR